MIEVRVKYFYILESAAKFKAPEFAGAVNLTK